MKCPVCDSEMALVDFCCNIRLYQCPNCFYDCTVEDGDVE